jgi:hypothetical protein
LTGKEQCSKTEHYVGERIPLIETNSADNENCLDRTDATESLRVPSSRHYADEGSSMIVSKVLSRKINNVELHICLCIGKRKWKGHGQDSELITVYKGKVTGLGPVGLMKRSWWRALDVNQGGAHDTMHLPAFQNSFEYRMLAATRDITTRTTSWFEKRAQAERSGKAGYKYIMESCRGTLGFSVSNLVDSRFDTSLCF